MSKFGKIVLAIGVGLAIPPIAPLVGLYVLYALVFERGGSDTRNIPDMLLQDFNFYEGADNPDGIFLELFGRKAGPIARVLDLLRISSKSHVRISKQEFRVRISGLGGSKYYSAPLSEITATACNVEKPAGQLYLGVFLIVGSFGYALGGEAEAIIIGIGVVLGIIFVFSYLFSKRFIIAFSTTEVLFLYGLGFKPALTGSGSISYDALLHIFGEINQHLVDAHVAKSKKGE
jgi:hypothetical protein